MITIENSTLQFSDNPRIVLSNGLVKHNCQIHQGERKLVEYPCLKTIELWIMTEDGWAIHDQVKA
jgi:hypothetical protein